MGDGGGKEEGEKIGWTARKQRGGGRGRGGEEGRGGSSLCQPETYLTPLPSAPTSLSHHVAGTMLQAQEIWD